jgi:hypothetical protein
MYKLPPLYNSTPARLSPINSPFLFLSPTHHLCPHILPRNIQTLCLTPSQANDTGDGAFCILVFPFSLLPGDIPLSVLLFLFSLQTGLGGYMRSFSFPYALRKHPKKIAILPHGLHYKVLHTPFGAAWAFWANSLSIFSSFKKSGVSTRALMLIFPTTIPPPLFFSSTAKPKWRQGGYSLGNRNVCFLPV